MKIKCKLFENNISQSGRKFDPESLKKAIDGYLTNTDNHMRLVELGKKNGMEDLSLKLTNVCGKVVSLDHKDGCVNTEIEILETPNGKIVQDFLSAGNTVKAYPAGYGKVNEDGVVEEFTLTGFTLDI